jgi:Zn-dependent protease with chaperone function
MHILMILIALAIAGGIRLATPYLTEQREAHWWQSLFLFLFPPLLLLMTAVAVVWMGYRGEMLGWQASWFGYLLAIAFLGWASLLLLKQGYQVWQAARQICTYPQQVVEGKVARILETPFPYSAQIGFWQPELALSQGLLVLLDRPHLQAVLAHEQAHADCRDTFWFFWLGWLRTLTSWLPKTQLLWQELLLLRELRADRRAATQIDALLLAESLLLVIQTLSQSPLPNFSESFCAALSDTLPCPRLTERIEALLAEPAPAPSFSWWRWSWLFLALLPLITVPFHD